MRRTRERMAGMTVVCGLACGLAGSVSAAPPYLINISGATLLKNFLKAPASTNDFLDCDNDGTTRDQLAPFDVTPPFLTSQRWHVQYRSVGSLNGLQELVDYGRTYAVGIDGVELAGSAAADDAMNNRTNYVVAGVVQNPPGGIANGQNPGSAPVRSLKDGTYEVSLSTDGGVAGIQIDLAPIDVPTAWAVTAPGSDGAAPSWSLRPTQPGYGLNPRESVNKDGSATSFNHMLVDPGTINFNFANPDGNTMYGTDLAFGPIAVITNLGTGMQQIKLSQLQHMAVTGRLPLGENLVQVTRDAGSGTRNGYNNTTGVDPSWGVGENIGDQSNTSAQDILGPNFRPSNKGGSSRMEGTVRNHRLAIGYTGAERGAGSWLTSGQMEILGVQNDVGGGTMFVRPTISNVLTQGLNGYHIGGPAVIAHFGDAKASAPGYPYFGSSNGNPLMRNQHAAAYLNNITASVAAFKGDPGGDPTVFSPGELLATQLILPNSRSFVTNLTSPLQFVANASLNPALQSFALNNNVLANSAYATFNATTNGLVPTRTTGTVYSDGVANGANYITQAGAAVSYASALSARNKIAGDFNNDAKRDWNDALEMVKAWRARNGGPAWQAGTTAIIEVLGDFNGDGNFNTADVRYWADGLAVDPTTRVLSRKEGFSRVDAALAGEVGGATANFFGTTLATPKAYLNGDSRGDVAGPNGRQTVGWAPIGADGVVNGLDIDYVFAQFSNNANITDGAANWLNLNEAAFVDLSADMNGDLVVDWNDVKELVQVILGTQIGDVDLSGSVSVADRAIAQGNLGNAGGWSMGDVTGDGQVTQADVDYIDSILCPADVNSDGMVTFVDLNVVLSFFGQPGTFAQGDTNRDGVVNFLDLNNLLSAFGTTCP